MAARTVLSRAFSVPTRLAVRLQAGSTPMLQVLPSTLLTQQRKYSDAAHGLAREEVKHRILDVLHTFDKADRNKINENAHFVTDLGLDSLDVVEAVMAVEEEFAIEIPDEAADRIMSVPDAINYVASQPEAI